MSIKIWLIKKIASETGIEENEVSCDIPFQDFNLDSLDTISLFFDLEQEFELENLDPSILSDNNTINKLTKCIESLK